VENATAAGLMAVRSDIARAAGQVQSDVVSKFGSVGTMVKNVEEGFRRLGNTLVGAGGAAMGTFTLPLILGMRSLVSEGQEFETELYRVLSIFDDGKKPIQELRAELQNFAQTLAITTQYSSTEVLQSMYRMGQAGYGLADIYKMLPSILELATAQQYDLEQTFNIVNAAMKSYQFEASDTAKVVNQLAGAATMYNLTMDDYGKGLKYIMGLSKTLNQDFSEMLMLFGLLTDRGKTGMQAGRVIRDSIADIIAPTKQNTEILAKHNLELYTNQEQINGAAHAYQAAKAKLEAMEQGYRSSNDELISVNASILTYKQRLEQAKKAGNAQDVAYLTRAVNDLNDAYQWMGLGRKADASAIAKQRAEMTELQAVYDESSVEGMIRFTDIIKQIADSQMTAGEIAKVFGKQSADSIIMLVDAYRNNPNIFEEQSAAIRDSTEATKQAAIQTESTAFQVKQLQEALRQVKQAGYEALAPVIAVLNKFFQDNIDTIKELVAEFVESFVPAFERGISIVEGIIDFFADMDKGNRKMLFGIIASGITFMAVLGPILLYGGTIAWATSSILKLGRGAWDTAVLIGTTTRMIWNAVTAAKGLSTATLGTTAMYEALNAEAIVMNPSIVASGSAFGTLSAGAGGATGALGGLAGAITAALPYLAVFGIAAYALYWAWKNNWLGLKDFTDQVVEDISESIRKSNIDKAIEDLKTDYENSISALMLAVEGLIEANGDKIQEATGLWMGSYFRSIIDKAKIMYDLGKTLWDFFITGLTNQPIPDDPTRSMTAKWMNDIRGQQGEVSDFMRGFIKGISSDEYFVNEAGNLEKSNKLITREQEQRIKDNATFKEQLFKQNTTPFEQIDGKMSFNAKYNPFQGLSGNVSATNSSINKVNNSLKKVGNTTANIEEDIYQSDEFLKLFIKDADKFQDAIANGDQDTAIQIMKENLESTDILQSAADAGDESGKYFGDAMANASLPYIQSILDMAGGGLQDIGTTGSLAGIPQMSAKGAIGERRSLIGDYWYSLDQINSAAAGAKSYDGEYPSISELLKGVTPIGISPSAIKSETVENVVPSLPTSNIVDTTAAESPALAATSIQNQYNYSIQVTVNPKEIMTKEGVQACGEEIAQVVKDKLGSEYRQNEAV
jgi:uncharacterized protein YihD (DUF1040 family)